MNKSELIASMTEKSGVSKNDCKASLNAIMDSIIASLASGDEVWVDGFGVWKVREREARVGRNPLTNEEILIPASRAIEFFAAEETIKYIEK